MLERKNNLPAEVGSSVGRQQELAAISDTLAYNRLVTLTGPGGCGKTHLGVRVAQGFVSTFADGVWLVLLAPVMDAAQVPRAVASALGIGGRSEQPLEDTLLTSLMSRELLLVLDNCEHLISACAHVAESLLAAVLSRPLPCWGARCAGLRVALLSGHRVGRCARSPSPSTWPGWRRTSQQGHPSPDPLGTPLVHHETRRRRLALASGANRLVSRRGRRLD